MRVSQHTDEFSLRLITHSERICLMKSRALKLSTLALCSLFLLTGCKSETAGGMMGGIAGAAIATSPATGVAIGIPAGILLGHLVDHQGQPVNTYDKSCIASSLEATQAGQKRSFYNKTGKLIVVTRGLGNPSESQVELFFAGKREVAFSGQATRVSPGTWRL